MRYNSIDIVQKRTKKFKGGYSMSHRLLANTEYFREPGYWVLKTKEGNIRINCYLTRSEDENERIRKVFSFLREENNKAKGNMTIEEAIDITKKRYHVCISREEIPRAEIKPYQKPEPRTMYLKITQTNSVKLHQKTRKV